MASIRSIDNCSARFIAASRGFLRDAVLGSGVRFECVVSGKTCCEVLSLMPTYGTRMAEFFLQYNSIKDINQSTKSTNYEVQPAPGTE